VKDTLVFRIMAMMFGSGTSGYRKSRPKIFRYKEETSSKGLVSFFCKRMNLHLAEKKYIPELNS